MLHISFNFFKDKYMLSLEYSKNDDIFIRRAFRLLKIFLLNPTIKHLLFGENELLGKTKNKYYILKLQYIVQHENTAAFKLFGFLWIKSK